MTNIVKILMYMSKKWWIWQTSDKYGKQVMNMAKKWWILLTDQRLGNGSSPPVFRRAAAQCLGAEKTNRNQSYANMDGNKKTNTFIKFICMSMNISFRYQHNNCCVFLKNCHNPFGKPKPTPPPYSRIPFEHARLLKGASLSRPTRWSR